MDQLTEEYQPRASRRKSLEQRKKLWLRVIMMVLTSALFVVAVVAAARLGVSMARERLPKVVTTEKQESAAPEAVIVGGARTPLYLSSSSQRLRAFFSKFPTVEERAAASLNNSGVRRLNDELTLHILRVDADVVQIQVVAGPISGAVYWLHHTQLVDRQVVDQQGVSEDSNIISPIPGSF